MSSRNTLGLSSNRVRVAGAVLSCLIAVCWSSLTVADDSGKPRERVNNDKTLLAEPPGELPWAKGQEVPAWQLYWNKESEVPEHYKKLLEQQQTIRELQKRLESTKAHVLQRLQEERNLPSLEHGMLHAFRTEHRGPVELAETLERLLGARNLRMVPDEDGRTLLVYANEEVMKQISVLIDELEATADDSEGEAEEEGAEASEYRSLMVRVFCLADGLSEGEGSDPGLPESVLQAVSKLGLYAPMLVCQNTMSLVVHGDESHSQFGVRSPALLHDRIVLFECQGDLFLREQPLLDISVELMAGEVPVELEGRLSAPIGHFMVLGTANYASVDVEQVLDESKEKLIQQEKKNFSRFAFVVQVVEAESLE